MSVSLQSPVSLLGLSSKSDDVDEFIWRMIGTIGTLCECGYEHSRLETTGGRGEGLVTSQKKGHSSVDFIVADFNVEYFRFSELCI